MEYSVTMDATGTAAVLTIQQPATGSKRVEIMSVEVGAVTNLCTVSVERDGTAATATLATATKASKTAPAPAFKAYTASDAGAGAVLHRFVVGVGQSQFRSMIGTFLGGDGTGNNFTVRVAAGVSTQILVTVKVREEASIA